MKAKKYENIEFIINHSSKDFKIDFIWKKGELYISLSGVFLTDGTTWYEIPVKELENICIVREEPLKLRFKIPSIDIVISGEHAERLLALRHFLLPYISGKKEEDEMKALLKLWIMNIRDTTILKNIMKTSEDDIKTLIERAKNEKYLDEKDDVTTIGESLFTDREKRFLHREG